MNIYLAIITTVLVITQIIRVTQNHIQLYRQNKHFMKDLAWLNDNEVTKEDFLTQRLVNKRLLLWLDRALDDHETEFYNESGFFGEYEVVCPYCKKPLGELDPKDGKRYCATCFLWINGDGTKAEEKREWLKGEDE